MWSAYLTAKLFFLLLLVEASLGRGYFQNGFQDVYVEIRWDIMNKTRDSYSANVTIFNCLKNHDIEGPWKLGWTWSESEILLSTVGAEGTQRGNDLVGEYTRPKNRVTVVDLPPQTKAKHKVANCCKGGMISSWYKEADLAKSSSSFQITVGRVNTRYHRPPYLVRFTSPRSKYICDSMWEADETPGYLYTWSSVCGGLSFPKKIHNK